MNVILCTSLEINVFFQSIALWLNIECWTSQQRIYIFHQLWNRGQCKHLNLNTTKHVSCSHCRWPLNAYLCRLPGFESQYRVPPVVQPTAFGHLQEVRLDIPEELVNPGKQQQQEEEEEKRYPKVPNREELFVNPRRVGARQIVQCRRVLFLHIAHVLVCSSSSLRKSGNIKIVQIHVLIY